VKVKGKGKGAGKAAAAVSWENSMMHGAQALRMKRQQAGRTLYLTVC